jgi:hypothetical protein
MELDAACVPWVLLVIAEGCDVDPAVVVGLVTGPVPGSLPLPPPPPLLHAENVNASPSASIAVKAVTLNLFIEPSFLVSC